MNFTLRKAELTDADQLYRLVENFATSFKPMKTAFNHSLEQFLVDDSVFIDVAILENEVVGYCLAFDHYAFYANGRVTWVEEITVREDLREKGIGRALMEAVYEWADARESKLVGLATRRAAAFYKAIGYEESAIFFRKMVANRDG